MPKTLSADDIQQFREAMRHVAESAFATRGAQGVTMRELARELSCSAMGLGIPRFSPRRTHKPPPHAPKQPSDLTPPATSDQPPIASSTP